MKIAAGSTKVKHKFFVLPGLSQPMIIGIDLLQKFNFSLLFNNQDIRLLKNSFKIDVCEIGPSGLASLDKHQESELNKLIDKGTNETGNPRIVKIKSD